MNQEEVYRRKFGPKFLGKPYVVVMDLNDKAQLAEWKKDINKLIIEAKNDHEAGSSYIREIIGEHPDEKDYILFAIGKFLRSIKTDWKKIMYLLNPIRAIQGGVHQLTHFGKDNKDINKNEFDNCIDGVTLVKKLAEMYGIQGEIHDEEKGMYSGHHYWQEKTELGVNGRVVDIFVKKRFMVQNVQGAYSFRRNNE